jgi:hypothetical protein
VRGLHSYIQAIEPKQLALQQSATTVLRMLMALQTQDASNHTEIFRLSADFFKVKQQPDAG